MNILPLPVFCKRTPKLPAVSHPEPQEPHPFRNNLYISSRCIAHTPCANRAPQQRRRLRTHLHRAHLLSDTCLARTLLVSLSRSQHCHEDDLVFACDIIGLPLRNLALRFGPQSLIDVSSPAISELVQYQIQQSLIASPNLINSSLFVISTTINNHRFFNCPFGGFR